MAAVRWTDSRAERSARRVLDRRPLVIRGPGLVLAGPVLACMLSVVAPVPAQAQTVQVLVNPGIEVFRVGDFNPDDTRFHPHVFTIQMSNDVEGDVELALEIFRQAGGVQEMLASGRTDPFLLGTTPVFITNRDLTESNGEYELQGYTVESEGQELEDQILALGYLPEGQYCFRLTLYEGGVSVSSSTACITPTNPLNLELRRPGTRFGGGLPLIFSAHPQFQWSSRASRWLIEIAQAQPGDASGEDVLDHVPVYRQELDASSVFGMGGGTVSWTYPSAAEDLARGRIYCWRVTAHVQTSGGQEEISSEIFCFRRWDAADLAAAPVAEALEAYLEDLVDDLGPELEGMIPTGVVLVDGVAVDATELKQLLEDMKSGKIEVLERRIE